MGGEGQRSTCTELAMASLGTEGTFADLPSDLMGWRTQE